MVAAVIAEPTPGYLRAGILAPVSGLGVCVLLLMAHTALPRRIAQNKKASPERPESWRARLDRPNGTRDRVMKVRLAQGRCLPRTAWALYPLGGYEFVITRTTALASSAMR